MWSPRDGSSRRLVDEDGQEVSRSKAVIDMTAALWVTDYSKKRCVKWRVDRQKLYSAEQNSVVAETEGFYFEHQAHIKSERLILPQQPET
jgi:hypothetical protein